MQNQMYHMNETGARFAHDAHPDPIFRRTSFDLDQRADMRIMRKPGTLFPALQRPHADEIGPPYSSSPFQQ
jgi:hypothetical protein